MNMKSSPNKTEARADKMKNEKKNGGGGDFASNFC